jgi:YtkA-like
MDAIGDGAEMKKIAIGTLAGALLMMCSVSSAWPADVRAKADVACTPTATKLEYDCIIKLANARTGEPLKDVTLTVGADMPSMPAAHNVRPVKAEAGQEPGVYQARIQLEMLGDWALRLDLSGKVRDRVIATMRFEAERAVPAATSKTPPRHRH